MYDVLNATLLRGNVFCFLERLFGSEKSPSFSMRNMDLKATESQEKKPSTVW